jgi:Ca2+-binding EF-hand superfamily protein
VDQAFDGMDPRNRGVIEPQLITQTFNPFQHPDVLSKVKSPQDVLQDFTDHFDVGGMVEGKVTKEEFVNYYTNISASIASDDYFEMIIRNCWKLPPSVVKSPDKTKMMSTMSQNVKQQANMTTKLAAPAPNLLNQLSGMTAMQKMKAEEEVAVSKPTPMEIAYAGPNTSNTPAPAVNGAAALPPRCTSGVRLINPTEAAKAGPAEKGIIPPGIVYLINKLKADIQARGVHGYNELERLFWMMDEDKSTELSLPEFNNVMKDLNINLDSTQLRLMFDTFDKDHSGSISIDEFMDSIRDRLSEKRLRLVHAAFAKLDRTRRGRVKAEDLVMNFDASQHPEVMAGRMSVKACQQEFLESFDLGKEFEGFATQREFIGYYTNLGSCINSDDYFELLITNCWRLDDAALQRAASRDGLVSKIRGSMQKQQQRKQRNH